MSLRSAHGSSGTAAIVRVETLPADELPAPVPAPAGDLHEDARRAPRQQGGRFVPGNPLARLGGLAKARRVRLVDSLGLRRLADDATFKSYLDAAEEFTAHHRSELAKQAGGELGAAPSSMIASAAMQLAASRWAFDKGMADGDAAMLKMGSTFANESRQNLLAAYELAVREAKARETSVAMTPSWMKGE